MLWASIRNYYERINPLVIVGGRKNDVDDDDDDEEYPFSTTFTVWDQHQMLRYYYYYEQHHHRSSSSLLPSSSSKPANGTASVIRRNKNAEKAHKKLMLALTEDLECFRLFKQELRQGGRYHHRHHMMSGRGSGGVTVFTHMGLQEILLNSGGDPNLLIKLSEFVITKNVRLNQDLQVKHGIITADAPRAQDVLGRGRRAGDEKHLEGTADQQTPTAPNSKRRGSLLLGLGSLKGLIVVQDDDDTDVVSYETKTIDGDDEEPSYGKQYFPHQHQQAKEQHATKKNSGNAVNEATSSKSGHNEYQNHDTSVASHASAAAAAAATATSPVAVLKNIHKSSSTGNSKNVFLKNPQSNNKQHHHDKKTLRENHNYKELETINGINKNTIGQLRKVGRASSIGHCSTARANNKIPPSNAITSSPGFRRQQRMIKSNPNSPLSSERSLFNNKGGGVTSITKEKSPLSSNSWRELRQKQVANEPQVNLSSHHMKEALEQTLIELKHQQQEEQNKNKLKKLQVAGNMSSRSVAAASAIIDDVNAVATASPYGVRLVTTNKREQQRTTTSDADPTTPHRAAHLDKMNSTTRKQSKGSNSVKERSTSPYSSANKHHQHHKQHKRSLGKIAEINQSPSASANNVRKKSPWNMMNVAHHLGLVEVCEDEEEEDNTTVEEVLPHHDKRKGYNSKGNKKEGLDVEAVKKVFSSSPAKEKLIATRLARKKRNEYQDNLKDPEDSVALSVPNNKVKIDNKGGRNPATNDERNLIQLPRLNHHHHDAAAVETDSNSTATASVVVQRRQYQLASLNRTRKLLERKDMLARPTVTPAVIVDTAAMITHQNNESERDSSVVNHDNIYYSYINEDDGTDRNQEKGQHHHRRRHPEHDDHQHPYPVAYHHEDVGDADAMVSFAPSDGNNRDVPEMKWLQAEHDSNQRARASSNDNKRRKKKSIDMFLNNQSGPGINSHQEGAVMNHNDDVTMTTNNDDDQSSMQSSLLLVRFPTKRREVVNTEFRQHSQEQQQKHSITNQGRRQIQHEIRHHRQREKHKKREEHRRNFKTSSPHSISQCSSSSSTSSPAEPPHFVKQCCA